MKNRTRNLTNGRGQPTARDAQTTGTSDAPAAPTPPAICLQPARAQAALELAATSQSQPQPTGVLSSRVGPFLEKRTRNGKIARLPKVHRDMVNRMLFNNIRPARIVGALEELGYTVTPRNISNWKTRGGYHDWRLAQEHALQTRLRMDNFTEALRKESASDLPEVGLQAAAIQLSQFFLTPEAAQLLASDPDEYNRRLGALGKVAIQLKSLQKYRDDCAADISQEPEYDRRKALKETEDIRETFSSKSANHPNTPNTPHRNFLPVSGS